MTSKERKDLQVTLECVMIARTREMQAHEFYLEAAERTSEPAMKATFQELAEWELEHYQLMDKRYEELSRALEEGRSVRGEGSGAKV